MFPEFTPPPTHRTDPTSWSRRGVRRAGTGGLAAVMALGTLPAVVALSTAANAAVVHGENISAFPDRDMVVAVGYNAGEQLVIEVLRNDVVIGTTQGPAAETPEGVGLEVNHGPAGAPLPGDCWVNYTPDIVGGDVIRVTPVDRPGATPDTMTVADVAFTGTPTADANGDVVVTGTGGPLADIAVEFRRDKPDPRFRRGPFAAVSDGAGGWTATFRPTATSAEGLTADEQRDIAINEASWAAVVDSITETTLAELGEPGGVAAGCTGSADPNTVTGGVTQPINLASGDVTFSGTARAGVAAVNVTVGALAARDATLTPGLNGAASTWELTVPKTDLLTLPDGNVAVTPRFDTLAGTTHTVLKDTLAPAAPTASPAPGSYTSTQNVALTKPAGEGTSKVYWEIGDATVPDPDELSNLYGSQIAVSSTQTIKARLIDAAGNPGAVATLAYRIGPADTTPPPAPTINPATGTYRTAQSVTMSTTEAGAVIRYTVGTSATPPVDPTATSTQYTSALPVSSSQVVKAAAFDAAGNRSTVVTRTYTISTTTGDTVAPTVAPSAPLAGATGVSQTNNITMKFSEAVQGVTAGTVVLTNTATGATIPSAITYKPDTRGTILNPNATLAAGTNYTVTVTGGSTAIRDLAGNSLVNRSWSFTTTGTSSTTNTAPTLVKRSPGINATGFNRGYNITMNFNEAVQGVSTSTVTLRNPSGATITSSVIYKSDTFGVILNPGVTLAANTKYTVTVTNGIRDTAGLAFAGTSWSFTTGS